MGVTSKIIFLINTFIYPSIKGHKLHWWLFQLSGLRLAWHKLHPPLTPPERAPSTFIFWFAGICSAVFGAYTALYGITSQRYENRIDLLETRLSMFMTQYSVSQDDKQKKAISDIVRMQSKKCPVKPVLLEPRTIVYSLMFSENHQAVAEDPNRPFPLFAANSGALCRDILEIVQEFVENRSFDLSGIEFENAIFIGAVFGYADFRNADFYASDLSSAIFSKANLTHAEFIRSDLTDANFYDAILDGANFYATILDGADFTLASLANANLFTAIGLTAEQLSQASTLFGAKLPTVLDQELRKFHPHLFKDPSGQ